MQKILLIATLDQFDRKNSQCEKITSSPYNRRITEKPLAVNDSIKSAKLKIVHTMASFLDLQRHAVVAKSV